MARTRVRSRCHPADAGLTGGVFLMLFLLLAWQAFRWAPPEPSSHPGPPGYILNSAAARHFDLGKLAPRGCTFIQLGTFILPGSPPPVMSLTATGQNSTPCRLVRQRETYLQPGNRHIVEVLLLAPRNTHSLRLLLKSPRDPGRSVAEELEIPSGNNEREIPIPSFR